MKVCKIVLSLWAVFSFFVSPAIAQQSNSKSSPQSVPRLVNFSGRVMDAQGKALSGILGVTFCIYKEQYDGPPLWLETQNVRIDARGNYTVQLGASTGAGLPLDLFTSGEARWLGVRVNGQEEQPRILLLSVPYALKAADAETIDGLPASAFVLAAPGNAGPATGSSGSPASGLNQPNVGGSGTQNFVPLWTDNNGDLGNSVLFQSGSGNSADVGINTNTPAATLDVNGGMIARGPLQLPSTGTANASQGFTSQPFSLQGSAFNSSTQKAIGPTFQLQTEPSGNNSSNPAGTLNLLYGGGSGAPGETGLNIASNGQITFVKGQIFPGAGTITGVTAGTGLTGGGTSGNVTLSINIPFANQNYAQLKAPNTFTANQTVNANLSAKQLISNAAQGTAPLQVVSTTQVQNLNASLLGGFPPGAFQPAGSYASLGANSFTGDQSISGNVLSNNLVLPQTVSSSVGTITMSSASLLHACCSSGAGNIFVGTGAGNFVTTGGGNSAFGRQALQSDSSGQGNTAIGDFAMSTDTTGSFNTVVGRLGLTNNISGDSNTSVGVQALQLNTTGAANTAVGIDALISNTTGVDNTAVGSAALGNSTGGGNTALGSNAGVSNSGSTTGSNNTFLGAGSNPGTQLNLNNATAVGANAVVSESNALVLGNGVNVGIGTSTPAATLDVNGTGNFTGLISFAPGQAFPGTGTITGVSAGAGLLGGGNAGSVSLSVDTTKVPQLSGGNSFVGTQNVAGDLSTTGAVNGGVVNATTSFSLEGNTFAFGSFANSNVFLGFAGNSSSTNSGNTAVGARALGSNTNGGANTAVGEAALVFNTGGGNNTATGVGALNENTTGNNNTATGVSALSSNTTGSTNTANGIGALENNTTGGSNTAVGDNALFSSTSGSSNTAIGVAAGAPPNFQSTTGSNNTFVGSNANPGNQLALNNATAIGANAQVTASNAMVLGSINGVNGATADTLVGIGTTAPTAKLDVRGNANFTGLISFAPGQPFPGTGTITGVTAGTDLTGGGNSGGVTLSLDTTKVPQLASANTFSATQTIKSGDLALSNGNLDLPATGVVNLNGSTLLSASTTGGSISLGIGAANPNSGADNVAVGLDALFRSPTGQLNTAIGAFALQQDTTGHDNVAGGGGALEFNTSGCCNSAVGSGALESNTSGSNNTAEGDGALQSNTTGNNNTALGSSAGLTTNFGSITGSNNTFVGSASNPGTLTTLTNATAIGANAQVTASNAMVLGSINGVNGAVASTNVGIGTTAPAVTLDVAAASGSAHDPVAQFGSTGTTDSDALKLYNGSGLTEVFISGATNNFVPGSAAGDGGLRVNPGKKILLGDSSAARLTIDSSGNVAIKGNLSKGGGSFKIDHPLDPLNKYLYHSFVESPDMMDVYNGNVVTDRRGIATVVLPDYFEALNRDFRYQLTVIGQFAQVIVANEIAHNRFIIRTSKPAVKVSWQVTGIRQDAFANLHRIPVEEEKPKEARGTYLHPEAFAAAKTGATVARLGNRQDH